MAMNPNSFNFPISMTYGKPAGSPANTQMQAQGAYTSSFSDDLVMQPFGGTVYEDESGSLIEDAHPDEDNVNVICVFNLPKNTQDDALNKFFSQYGKVERIFTIREKSKGSSKCKGYAFIYFSTMEEAQRARQEANNKTFEGKQIRVDLSNTKKKETKEAPESEVLCLFGLPSEVTEEEVRSAFKQKSITNMSKINLIKEKPSGRCKGYGFVYFDSVDAGIQAKEMCSELVIQGHMVRVDYSLTKQPRESDTTKRNQTSASFPRGARPCNVLGCFGLPQNAEENDFKKLFEAYGKVNKVDIVVDKNKGTCKGYGFVYFTKTEDAVKAIEAVANGLLTPTIKGQTIRVDYSLTTAPPQTRNTDSSGQPGPGTSAPAPPREWTESQFSYPPHPTPGTLPPTAPLSSPTVWKDPSSNSPKGDPRGKGTGRLSQPMSGKGGKGGKGKGGKDSVPVQVPFDSPQLQAPVFSQPPKEIPEDLVACLVLPQPSGHDASYMQGYDDARSQMLAQISTLLSTGQLTWNSSSSMVPMGQAPQQPGSLPPRNSSIVGQNILRPDQAMQQPSLNLATPHNAEILDVPQAINQTNPIAQPLSSGFGGFSSPGIMQQVSGLYIPSVIPQLN